MPASPTPPKQTLIRQFSIRWLFLVVTVGALLTLCLRFAIAGQYWAIGVVTAVVALVVLLVAHALMFGVAMLLARLLDVLRSQSSRRVDPFVSRTPPDAEETAP